MNEHKMIDELCNYALGLLISEIDEKNCIHEHVFNLSDQQCWGCELTAECLAMLKLMQHQQAPAVMAEKTVQQMQFLAASKHYIDARIRQTGHSADSCACDLCTWSRQAEHCLDT